MGGSFEVRVVWVIPEPNMGNLHTHRSPDLSLLLANSTRYEVLTVYQECETRDFFFKLQSNLGP
jgi:hypothetical protein